MPRNCRQFRSLCYLYMEMINMEIRLAVSGDFQAIRHYDSHIPSPRLADCIGSGQVYVLKDAGKIIGVLRYSLFWQTIPFLDLLYLDSRCRGQGHVSPLGSGHGESRLCLCHALHPGGRNGKILL